VRRCSPALQLPLPPVSPRNQRHGMHHLHRHPRLAQAGFELHAAAGVGGGDDGDAGLAEVGEFAVEQLSRHLGLRDVVNVGAAAASSGLGQIDELQPRDGAEEFARLARDPLAMPKIAGLVVGTVCSAIALGARRP
jgi:hypothetical protein